MGSAPPQPDRPPAMDPRRNREAMVNNSAGIILVGPHEQKTLDIAKASGVPIVRLGWVAPLEQADHVGGTDHKAGIDVGEYLVDLGHRDIAFLQGGKVIAGGWSAITASTKVLNAISRRGCTTCTLRRTEASSRRFDACGRRGLRRGHINARTLKFDGMIGVRY